MALFRFSIRVDVIALSVAGMIVSIATIYLGYLGWRECGTSKLVGMLEGREKLSIDKITIEGQQKFFVLDDNESMSYFTSAVKRAKDPARRPEGPIYSAMLQLSNGQRAYCYFTLLEEMSGFEVEVNLHPFAFDPDMKSFYIDFPSPLPAKLAAVLQGMKRPERDFRSMFLIESRCDEP